jgi:hypothetical protein
MAKSFGEAFKEARAAGLSEFTFEGNRYSTALAEETKEDFVDDNPVQTKDLTRSERIMQALFDYDDNYSLRSLADVEYRADIDEALSRSPLALLGYENIFQRSLPKGDVGDITHVLAEPSYKNEEVPMATVEGATIPRGVFNNPKFPRTTSDGSIDPTPISDLGYHGMYINRDLADEDYKRLTDAGILPGEVFVNQPLGKIATDRISPAGVVSHELGHAGADLVDTKLNNEEIVMRMIDENPEYYTDNMIYKDLGEGYGIAGDSDKETLRRAEQQAVKELIERGVPMNVINSDPDMQYGEPFFDDPRKDNFIQKFLKFHREAMLEEETGAPVQKEVNKRYRYARGGVVSLLGKDLNNGTTT